MNKHYGRCFLLTMAVLLSACGTTKTKLTGDPASPYPPQRAAGLYCAAPPYTTLLSAATANIWASVTTIPVARCRISPTTGGRSGG